MKSPVDDAPLENGELLAQCQKGDENALRELIRRFEGRLYRLTLRVSGDAVMAEEATVESFYKIWRKSDQWQGGTNVEAWICRIGVRTVLDLKRSTRRWRERQRHAAVNGDDKPVTDLAQVIIADERHERISQELNRAIGTLNEQDRALVHLYYFENHGLREIASILDATEGALKMRLARARERLRLILKDFDDD